MATNRYQRTRDDHSRENAEDYVELIAAITRERGKTRAIDLARGLGISHVTVAKTLQRLIREGLVTAQPYQSIHLTETGKQLAEAAETRHELVLSFLLALGVSPDAAETDTEGIEHHVSKETLEAMQRFLVSKTQT